MIRAFSSVDGHLVPAPAGSFEQAIWLDVHNPDEHERAIVEGIMPSHVPAREEVEQIEPSTRCFIDEAGIHLRSLYMEQIPEGSVRRMTSVACIIGEDRLVTIRYGANAEIDHLQRQAADRQIAIASTTDLAILLFEEKVETHADLVEAMHCEVAALRTEIHESDRKDWDEVLRRLGGLDDENGRMRLCMLDTSLGLAFLLRHLAGQVQQQTSLHGIQQDVDALTSHVAYQSEDIQFLMDSTRGFIGVRQNQINKGFSIAAVMFLPPTLIAGIYGMNFRFMPGLDWPLGYPLAIAVMVAAGLGPLWFFRRRGWL
ncbi:CorA family divalent cation transporter [Spiribacter onubensis]|uniref:CorA family divalent cation transporter n=1 Tax=Spiribacter onubensis TaxID=3122420 RepID=A0ABV3SAR5_9GAMM